MRVLHVLTDADSSGASGGPLSVSLRQAAIVEPLGIDVEIAASWDGKDPPGSIGNVPAHLFTAQRLSRQFPSSSLVSRGMQRYLTEHISDFDLVHIHLARDIIPLAALRLARRAGVPVVSQTHGMVIHDDRLVIRLLDLLAVRRSLRACAVNLALTAIERDRLIVVGAKPENVRVLPNPAPDIHAQGTGEGRRAAAHRPEVLFMARLHPRKGALKFAESAVHLLRAGTQADFVLCGPDGGELQSVLRLIGESGFGSALRYEGVIPRERAEARLAQADVFVLPSKDEPFPMTVLEAMAVGTPTITMNDCHIAPLIRQEQAGLVVEPTIEAVGAAVLRLLTDPSLASDMTAAGQRMCSSVLSGRQIADQLRSLYDEACAGA